MKGFPQQRHHKRHELLGGHQAAHPARHCVDRPQLLGLPLGRLVKPAVVDGDGDLVGQRLQERDVVRLEALDSFPFDAEDADDARADLERHVQLGTGVRTRRLHKVRVVPGVVGKLGLAGLRYPADHAGADRLPQHRPGLVGNGAVGGAVERRGFVRVNQHDGHTLVAEGVAHQLRCVDQQLVQFQRGRGPPADLVHCPQSPALFSLVLQDSGVL